MSKNYQSSNYTEVYAWGSDINGQMGVSQTQKG